MDKWQKGPPHKPHKWLLMEAGKESRWLDEVELIELDIPNVKIPTEVPMKNYKWTPTFHGSLAKPKEEPPEAVKVEPIKKEQSVAQTATSKAKAKKGATKAPKKKPAPAIFQWTFQSSQDVGGQKAVYSTLLRSNGDMTCNCPGWIFKRGTDRFCKHTKMVEEEGKKLYKDHKAGKELPAMELVGAGNIAIASNPKKEGDLKYGRRIILD